MNNDGRYQQFQLINFTDKLVIEHLRCPWTTTFASFQTATQLLTVIDEHINTCPKVSDNHPYTSTDDSGLMPIATGMDNSHNPKVKAWMRR